MDAAVQRTRPPCPPRSGAMSSGLLPVAAKAWPTYGQRVVAAAFRLEAARIVVMVVVPLSTTQLTFRATVSPFVSSIWKISTSESVLVKTGHVWSPAPPAPFVID